MKLYLKHEQLVTSFSLDSLTSYSAKISMAQFLCFVSSVLFTNISSHFVQVKGWNFTTWAKYTCVWNLHSLWDVNFSVWLHYDFFCHRAVRLKGLFISVETGLYNYTICVIFTKFLRAHPTCFSPGLRKTVFKWISWIIEFPAYSI